MLTRSFYRWQKRSFGKGWPGVRRHAGKPEWSSGRRRQARFAPQPAAPAFFKTAQASRVGWCPNRGLRGWAGVVDGGWGERLVWRHMRTRLHLGLLLILALSWAHAAGVEVQAW